MTLLTRREVAQRLGVSERTLDRMTAEGAGPHVTRIGRHVKFRDDLLVQWIRARG